MPLTPINELVQNAREHRYAIGYFESWNLESLQGVLDAAETTRSPIIIGFNGDFLSHPDRKHRVSNVMPGWEKQRRPLPGCPAD